jgi:chemotaxis protein MotA
MITLPIGFIAVLLIIVSAASGANVNLFSNTHALLLVVVGTFAVLLFSNPLAGLKNLGRSILNLWSGLPQDSERLLVELSKKRTLGQTEEGQHPLIAYATSLWEQGLDEDTFHELLTQKTEELNRRSEQPVLALRNLSKYPPTLGMMGTVIGLVSLFGKLTPETRGGLGASLALALTATFYGLAMANALFMPLADRLQAAHQESSSLNEKIYRILLLIHQEKPATIIRDEVYGRSA